VATNKLPFSAQNLHAWNDLALLLCIQASMNRNSSERIVLDSSAAMLLIVVLLQPTKRMATAAAGRSRSANFGSSCHWRPLEFLSCFAYVNYDVAPLSHSVVRQHIGLTSMLLLSYLLCIHHGVMVKQT
jgi:hypothetical protein